MNNKYFMQRAATIAFVAAAFFGPANAGDAPKADGDIAVPDGYASWTKFVPTVVKPNGQIREIYINDTGLQANKGEAFPYGTVSVMEIYSSKDDGGKPAKDELKKIFVMSKGEGWGGKQADSVIPNGDWLYGAYLADGKTAATTDFNACRDCHAPLAEDDYIARYDEHFAQK